MIIRSNFKNLPPVGRIEEGNYIFLWGPNGCGKSAIAHSVEYALTGHIADAAGRNIKSKAYVNTLAHEFTAEVEVLLDGMAHNGTRPRYNNVMADAMAAITGSSTALVQYMLEYGERFDTTETTVALDYPSWGQWVAAEGSVRRALLRIQKAAGASLRKARAEVKDLKTVLKYGGDRDPVGLEGVRDMLADALRAEAEAKALKKACDDAAIEWLKQVTQFAPHGVIKFYFGSEVRLGLVGKGPVPSGAETVECAIHLAALTRKPEESVYVLPDRAYDPQRLAHLLRILRMIPAAIVIAQSPIMPEGYDLEKFWVKIDVDVVVNVQGG
jgi:energy-coupling factor transporter ATP-binding protein EcfA2